MDSVKRFERPTSRKSAIKMQAIIIIIIIIIIINIIIII